MIKFYETEDRIEIYLIGPDYRTVPQLVLTGTRYLWIVCAKDVFYALAGDYIHVFDYKGNPVRKLLLDKPMDYFILDEKNGRILGFNSAGESEVFYIYELPSREG